MKTKNTNYFIFAFLLIFIGINSCGNQFPVVTYTIINNSSYDVNVDMFIDNNIVDSVTLFTNQSIEYYKYSAVEGEGCFPFDNFDSLLVVYDDTVKIKHNFDEQQIASRTMMLFDNWDMVENNEERRRYEYIFTNDDYVEGLNQ